MNKNIDIRFIKTYKECVQDTMISHSFTCRTKYNLIYQENISKDTIMSGKK